MKIHCRKLVLIAMVMAIVIALTGTFAFAAPNPKPPCTSYTYDAWGDCKPNGTQTRNVLTKTPSDCNIQDQNSVVPFTEQTCTYLPPCTTKAQIAPESQTVPETTLGSPTSVMLNGQPSKDTVTYLWEQTGGTTVTLSDPTNAKPTFAAPSVGPSGETLTFKLTVTGCSPVQTDSITTTINVTDVFTNSPPVASATVSPGTIIEETVVTLDGTGSSDPDGDALTYSWTQVGGSPTVVLTPTDSTGSIVTFTAPIEYPAGASLTFRLTVSDGFLSASTDKIVNVTWFNFEPVVNLVCPLDPVDENAMVNLMGSGSTDDDGDGIASYEWSQLNGPPNVDLTGISSNADISFNAPYLGYQQDGKISFRLTVKDNGGLSINAECTITIKDITPPVLTLPDDMTVEATGPDGASVTYSASAYDAVDGDVDITCDPTSGSSFKLDEIRNVSCSATDKAGNTASDSFTVTVVDTTPPTINCTVPDQTMWYGADVIVNCTASDAGSGLADPADASFTLTTTVSAGTETASASTGSKTVTDNSGNSATAGPYIFKVDKKAPTVSCGTADTAWHATDQSVTCTATDDGSGPASQTVTLSTSVTSGTETSNASTNSQPVCDGVGNCATAGPVTGFKIDKKAPTAITFSDSISNGASYYFGYVPSVPTCTATDNGSGFKSCVVTGYNTSVGSHTLTATAKDNVDNESTATLSYTVLAWTLKGFYQPVDMGGVWNTVKNGSTVPLKFEVFAGSTELTDVSKVKSVTSALVACGSGTEDVIEEVITTTGGTVLRYDTTGGQFIDNWKTPATAGKCYRVTMTTQDGSSLVALFKLK